MAIALRDDKGSVGLLELPIAQLSRISGARPALRVPGQSLTKALCQERIHIAHVVTEGAIRSECIRRSFAEHYSLTAFNGVPDGSHIADDYSNLHAQPRETWRSEIDPRRSMQKL